MSDWWNKPGADERCPTSAEWLRVMRQLRPAIVGTAEPQIREPAAEPHSPEPAAEDGPPPAGDQAR